MEETSETIVSRINVRELISVYENRAEYSEVDYSRPRAKSLGNILADNVIVRNHTYNCLEDVQNALIKIETNLNYYLVYDKQKHVTFQEQLFNLLTSIINIETDTEDGPKRKKGFISKTQTLVSILNQKLPNLALSHKPKTSSNEVVHRKYENYDNSTEIKTELTDHTELEDTEITVSVKKLKEHFQPPLLNNSVAIQKFNESPKNKLAYENYESSAEIKPESIESYSESSDGTNIEDITVSVNKLKEYFQPKGLDKLVTIQKLNGSSNKKSEHRTISKRTTDVTNTKAEKSTRTQTSEASNSLQKITPIGVKRKIQVESKPETRVDIAPDTAVPISVVKLRNMFEEKTKENSVGLEAILDAPRSFQYEVNIPYTERNLEKYRLFRANSGNYMNYTGLLKKTDLSRSKSLHELNYKKYATYKDHKNIRNSSEEDSGEESDSSLEADSIRSVESIKNVALNETSVIQVPLGKEQSMSRTLDIEPAAEPQNVKEVVLNHHHSHAYRTAEVKEVGYSSTSIVTTNQSETNGITVEYEENSDSGKISSGALRNPEELQSSTRTVEDENGTRYSSPTVIDLSQSQAKSVSTKSGVDEVEVNVFTSTTDSSNEVQRANLVNGETEAHTFNIEDSETKHSNIVKTSSSSMSQTRTVSNVSQYREVEVKSSVATAGNPEEFQSSTRTVEGEIDIQYSSTAIMELNQSVKTTSTVSGWKEEVNPFTTVTGSENVKKAIISAEEAKEDENNKKDEKISLETEMLEKAEEEFEKLVEKNNI